MSPLFETEPSAEDEIAYLTERVRRLERAKRNLGGAGKERKKSVRKEQKPKRVRATR